MWLVYELTHYRLRVYERDEHPWPCGGNGVMLLLIDASASIIASLALRRECMIGLGRECIVDLYRRDASLPIVLVASAIKTIL